MNKYQSAGVHYVDIFNEILHKMPIYNDRAGGKDVYELLKLKMNDDK